MVAVVQLVEHQVVILAVAGSSPVSHPSRWEGLLALPLFCSHEGLQPYATPLATTTRLSTHYRLGNVTAGRIVGWHPKSSWRWAGDRHSRVAGGTVVQLGRGEEAP